MYATEDVLAVAWRPLSTAVVGGMKNIQVFASYVVPAWSRCHWPVSRCRAFMGAATV